MARCEADPYCPEIKAWNARRLDSVWENLSDGEQSQATIPFWAIVWPGARALARYILDHPEEFEGKRVLDAACGSGFASIAAAIVGSSVLAIDMDPLATEAAALTAALNRVNFPIETGDAFRESILNRFCPDVIICGDVFYEPALAEAATRFLENSARHGI
ncbi:MAG: 50S ribosomal protein L11 methyltransferase, partial [Leptospirales bacterium]|nr:50S ribosomal protein L11 methyltransferase [Leptospirales bacterium]